MNEKFHVTFAKLSLIGENAQTLHLFYNENPCDCHIFPTYLPTIMDMRDEYSHSPVLPSSSFPQDPSEFDADPRISFSKLSNSFILEADDGQEFEFDNALKRWVPVVCPVLPYLTPYHISK